MAGASKQTLQFLGRRTDEHEFFNPIPRGYKKGATKYVVVTGSVISGLGKGVLTASIGRLLKKMGLNVTPIKFDGYLNVDAGTLNPFRHGEVFVLDDGTECDMDLGTYERFLDSNLSSMNYLTAGKIFKLIIDKERAGKYLGKDVLFIPHVTGEIKKIIRELAMKTKADIVLVEVGGTVGDIENSYFIEAMRELAHEEGRKNVCFINVTYILEPPSIGEQKSKAAQLGVKTLMSLGIQPNIIICRSERELFYKIKEKLSVYSNVPVSHIISAPNVQTVYEIPLLLKKENLHQKICSVLGMRKKIKKISMNKWKKFIEKVKNPSSKITVVMAGKYTRLRDSYVSILEALTHAGAANDCRVMVEWLETSRRDNVMKKILEKADGLIVPGGFGSRGVEGKIKCIKYARENHLPFLGLCYGFQLAVVEFARHVCKLKRAHTTEVDPKTPHPVVFLLPEQLQKEYVGASMRLGVKDVEIIPNTLAYRLYKKKSVRERFRHRYEVNPEYVQILEEHGFVFSGKAPNQPIVQIGELPSHRFFMGTQFHPEFTSRPLKPHPIFDGFIKACIE